ncbi:apolipoprotein Db isoform X1 [Trachinotus anak]|uniref:apolipoprotein Db isoform X1 n=2 Tax=Trachinotus anak TaxID=443729 RepID=UPI0039F2617B
MVLVWYSMFLAKMCPFKIKQWTKLPCAPEGTMSAAYLLLLLPPLVSAQTFHWGPCPTPKVQPNFNLQQYLGRWYEIEKLPASFERGKCIEANYAIRKDGTIRVLNSQFYKDKVRVAEGTAVVQDLGEPARLGVSFSYFTPYSPYWVLTTDYTSLSVVYSCTDILRLFRVEYAWILGRSRFLPPETVRYAKNLLTSEGIDLFRMKATDQTGCKDN